MILEWDLLFLAYFPEMKVCLSNHQSVALNDLSAFIV
jgi:hypothetical protein